MDKNKKNITPNIHNWLNDESKTWETNGIISGEQRKAILSQYTPDEKQQQNKLITVLAVLGSILVGLGVILFFASNWQVIPKEGKLTLIFTVLIAAYIIGYWIGFEKKNYPIVGRAIIFLGSIFFGAAIFLIAQIYHISGHYPNIFLFWAIGIFPIAYLLKTKPTLFLALAVIITWFGLETYSWIYPLDYYDVAHLYFPFIFLLLGITIYQLGWLHKKIEILKHFSGIYQGIGLLIGLSMVYYLTFKEIFYTPSVGKTQTIQYINMISYEYIVAYIALLITSVIILFLRIRNRSEISPYETAAILFLFLMDVALYFIPITDSGWIIPIIINIIFALLIIGVIILGYIYRKAFMINIGLVFFVLDVVSRYFDFFWKLLDRSIFFIIGGITLIAGSIILERTRRKMIADIKKEESHE